MWLVEGVVGTGNSSRISRTRQQSSRVATYLLAHPSPQLCCCPLLFLACPAAPVHTPHTAIWHCEQPTLQLIDERLQQVLLLESQRHAQLQPSGNIIQHVQRGTCV